MTGKIDLLKLLDYIEDYVIIKIWDEFPSYVCGSDIDLVVFDRHNVIRSIHEYYENNLSQYEEMQVTQTKGHYHVDFYFDKKLDLRIDLIEEFDFFENIAVKPAFFTKVLMDRQKKQFNKHFVFVPAEEDELTLRYFEYLEWVDRRPDKIKHLDYICNTQDEELKARFFDNTHRYIQIKRKTWPNNYPIGYNGRISSWTKSILRKVLKRRY